MAAYIASELPSAVRRLVLWGVPVLGFMERGDAMREEAPDYENDLPGVVQDYIERRYPTPVPWQLKVRRPTAPSLWRFYASAADGHAGDV